MLMVQYPTPFAADEVPYQNSNFDAQSEQMYSGFLLLPRSACEI